MFVLDINSKGILIDKPKRVKSKFKQKVTLLLKNVEPASLREKERGKKKLSTGEKILYQRMSKRYFVAAVIMNLNSDSHAFQFFSDLWLEIDKRKNVQKGDKSLESWLKEEMNSFNSGKRSTAASRINKRLNTINNRMQERLTKELNKFADLEDLETDIQELETEDFLRGHPGDVPGRIRGHCGGGGRG